MDSQRQKEQLYYEIEKQRAEAIQLPLGEIHQYLDHVYNIPLEKLSDNKCFLTDSDMDVLDLFDLVVTILLYGIDRLTNHTATIFDYHAEVPIIDELMSRLACTGFTCKIAPLAFDDIPVRDILLQCRRELEMEIAPFYSPTLSPSHEIVKSYRFIYRQDLSTNADLRRLRAFFVTNDMHIYAISFGYVLY